MDTASMKDVLRKTGVGRFEDIVAALALGRHNSHRILEEYVRRKSRQAPVSFAHSLLKPVLKETYGMMLYQEQMQHAAMALAGFGPEEADQFRRILCGRVPMAREEQRSRFVGGCRRHHRMDNETADGLFDAMTVAADHAFCKAYAVAMALIAYRMAWLKVHCPAEFVTAVLSNEADDSTRFQSCLKDALNLGISILPPDANRSGIKFAFEGKGVRFGLIGLKGVGFAVAQAIVDERDRRGPYVGLVDFCIRHSSSVANHWVLEALVKSGCFDFTGMHRARLFKGIKAASEHGAVIRRDAHGGQKPLFGDESRLDADLLPDCAPWDRAFMLEEELAIVGMFLAG